MTKAELTAQVKAIIDEMEDSQQAADDIADVADIYAADPPGVACVGEISGATFDRKENNCIVHIEVRDTLANSTAIASMSTDVIIMGENGGAEGGVLLSFLSAAERERAR